MPRPDERLRARTHRRRLDACFAFGSDVELEAFIGRLLREMQAAKVPGLAAIVASLRAHRDVARRTRAVWAAIAALEEAERAIAAGPPGCRVPPRTRSLAPARPRRVEGRARGDVLCRIKWGRGRTDGTPEHFRSGSAMCVVAASISAQSR